MSEQPPVDETIPDMLAAADVADATLPQGNDLWGRVGRRIIRRPSNWLNSPWPTERIIQYLTALMVLLGCTFAMLQVVHIDLVFTNNTPTGGDMGAHVMAPAYLRDHLLPNGQISGWSNYWYNGFPIYRFYMIIPALMILLLNVILPYGIAFKIVACLGVVTLPFCCWAFGRLARFRFPIPELMALAGLIFLFDESFTIYGGNVPSTMAGEFSFSIALSFAILGLGLFARGLETGKYRNWVAVLLALAMLSHGIVLIFVVLGALLMWLIWMDKTRFIYGLTMGITALALSAFWVFPFLFNHSYMTDMKYHSLPNGGGDSFWDMFFDLSPFWDILVSGLALVGFISSVIKRNLNGAWLGITCFALMAMVFLTRDSLPVIGLLWNPRLLPFLYLLRFMLMMVGIVDLAHMVYRAYTLRAPSVREVARIGAAIAVVVALVVAVTEMFFFRIMPGAYTTTKDGKPTYSWGIGGWDPINMVLEGKSDAYSDGWTRYNFNGYEGCPSPQLCRQYYGEYYNLVTTMADLGEATEPDLGCGRAMWENNQATGSYGTTMALMLLPHWTDGCIASQEGLFFEASGTTPYHFLTVAAMSQSSSNPVRELRYTNTNAAVGVPMMQKMGIKYLMVFTSVAKEQADARGDLELVRTSGPWNIYRVTDSAIVVPLTMQPVVVKGRDGDQRERNLELGTSWFQNPDEWLAMPADDGPSDWQRIDVQVDLTRQIGTEPMAPGRKVDIVVPAEDIVPVPIDPVTISNFEMGDQDLSFDVSEIDKPVLVKVSYFPNWEVDGADGPYRVAPNFMVVIPRSTHVYMHYETSNSDYFFYFVTLVGIGLLVFWRRRGDVRHRSAHPFLILPDDDDWVEPTSTPRELLVAAVPGSVGSTSDPFAGGRGLRWDDDPDLPGGMDSAADAAQPEPPGDLEGAFSEAREGHDGFRAEPTVAPDDEGATEGGEPPPDSV